MRIRYLLLYFMLTCSFPSYALAGNHYYKYTDKEGHTVISNALPPEAAKKGYEILSPHGTVVQTIPPQKTKAELLKEAALQKERERKEQAERLQQLKQEEQAHKDAILLKSFSTEADIQRAENDKIAAIEVLEEIISENVTGLKKQLSDAHAAVQEHAQLKGAVPEKLKKTILETERQLKENHAFLERKKIEKKEIHEKYQTLLERFKQLKVKNAPPPSTRTD